MRRQARTKVVIVGPHPPAPSPAARLCARLAAESTRSGAEVLTVDRLPSAADRSVPLLGLAGAAAVAWLARGADRLELVVGDGLVQRRGAHAAEHRAVAAAWRCALGVPRTARVHLLDPHDRRQLGLGEYESTGPGLEIVEHVAAVHRASPAPPVVDRGSRTAGLIEPEATWASLSATVAASASADRLAGLSLRLHPPPPPARSRNQQVVDHLRSRYGIAGRLAVEAVLGAKRLGRAATAAARARRGGAEGGPLA